MNKFTIVILSFCFCLNAYAGIYYELKKLPISSFTDDDMTIMESNVYMALDTTKDGEKLAWENKNTGHSGLAHPLKTYTHNDWQCRTLRIINRSNKNIKESKYEFCKVNNSWKIISNSGN